MHLVNDIFDKNVSQTFDTYMLMVCVSLPYSSSGSVQQAFIWASFQ